MAVRSQLTGGGLLIRQVAVVMRMPVSSRGARMRRR
jgi:hypothetical protein